MSHQSSNRHKRKRSYQHVSNPSRGGPGILLTCETSREVKCEREGREILNYYYYSVQQQPSRVDVPPKLTLDQELALLQQQTRNTRRNGPFQLFDTGCAGTAFFMYKPEEKSTDDACQREPKQIRTDKDKETTDTTTSSSIATQKDNTTTTTLSSWDPVAMVQAVARDIISSSTSSAIPASRFVTRMIPMQITCFASMTDIQATLPRLLERAPNPTDSKNDNNTDKDNNPTTSTTTTFRIHLKKRNCTHISSQAFIETVAPLVMKLKGWKVQMENPDHVVWMEVCKTLVGISILSRDDVQVAKNFNLAALRDKATANKGDEEAAA